ncbi:unnamed protein product [Trichobilharzia regenti]|nr:unnamed protein product [Trichobilharzia regenti]
MIDSIFNRQRRCKSINQSSSGGYITTNLTTSTITTITTATTNITTHKDNISSGIPNNNKTQRINHLQEHQTIYQQKPKTPSIWWQHTNHNVINENATETEDSDCLSELETKTKRDRQITLKILSGTSGEDEDDDIDFINDDYDDEDEDDESTSLSHSDVNNYPCRNQQNVMQYSLPLPVLVPIPIITPLISRTYPTNVMMHSTTCCPTTRDQSSEMESVSSSQLVVSA